MAASFESSTNGLWMTSKDRRRHRYNPLGATHHVSPEERYTPLLLSLRLGDREKALRALKKLTTNCIRNERVMIPFLKNGGANALADAFVRFAISSEFCKETARIVCASVATSARQLSIWHQGLTTEGFGPVCKMRRIALSALYSIDDLIVRNSCLDILGALWRGPAVSQDTRDWRREVSAALVVGLPADEVFRSLKTMTSKIVSCNHTDVTSRHLWVAACVLAARGMNEKSGLRGDVVEFLNTSVLTDDKVRDFVGPLGLIRLLSVVVALPNLKLLAGSPIGETLKWLTEKVHSELILRCITGPGTEAVEEASNCFCKEFLALVILVINLDVKPPTSVTYTVPWNPNPVLFDFALRNFRLVLKCLGDVYVQSVTHQDVFVMFVLLLESGARHPCASFRLELVPYTDVLVEISADTGLTADARFAAFLAVTQASVHSDDLQLRLISKPGFIDLLFYFIKGAATSEYVLSNSFWLVNVIKGFCLRPVILSRLLDAGILDYCDTANIFQLIFTRQPPALVQFVKHLQMAVLEKITFRNQEPIVYKSTLKAHLYLRFHYQQFDRFPHVFSYQAFCDCTSTLIAEDPRIAADALLLSACSYKCSPCLMYRSRLGLVEKSFQLFESPEKFKDLDQVAAGICYSLWKTRRMGPSPSRDEESLEYDIVGSPFCEYERLINDCKDDEIVRFDCGSSSEGPFIRGSRPTLSSASPYFEALLSDRFEEGKRLENGQTVRLTWLKPHLVKALFHYLHGCQLQHCPEIQEVLASVSSRSVRSLFTAADFICCEKLQDDLTQYFSCVASCLKTVIRAFEITENTHCEGEIAKKIFRTLFFNKKLLSIDNGFLDLVDVLVEATQHYPSFMSSVIEQVKENLPGML